MREMHLDPSYLPYLEQAVAGQPLPIREQDVAERRARMADLRRDTASAVPPGLRREIHESPPHGAPRPLRIVRPEGPGPHPCILYFHGGGWMYGSPEQSEPNAVRACQALQAVVVSPVYRKSPENPFPAAFEDCLATAIWARDNATTLDIDVGRMAVMGESSGGNLAAAVALAMRDKGRPLALQVLNYPALGTDFESASYRDNADAPILNAGDMVYFWQSYLGAKEASDCRELGPHAVPLNAADLSGLAPAFITIAEYDPLREDGRRYAERLIADGVSVELHYAARLPHGFLRAWDISNDATALGGAMLAALGRAFERPTD